MTFFLLVTANVGSIFEDPNGLLKIWVKEFLMTVQRLNPKFIALHCQEFGGKNYEESMSCVDEFVRALLSSQELLDFENRVFLDEDFSSNDKFTALGNLYFVHKSQKAYIWDFKDHVFVPAVGKEVHSGNIESVTTKDKLKFPQEFFPECKWSRKGFMKTRWLINGIAFDMINIHLFHDESNFISVSDFPSNYTKNRRKALEYTMNLINKDTFKDIPLFIFGDFNFRLDTKEVVKKLTNCAKPSKIKSQNGDLLKVIYHDSITDKKLSLERKKFHFSDENFFNNRQNISWLLEHDKELSHFDYDFNELKIEFPPSYPFIEEITSSSNYMNTRCPSWCDRILMNQKAKKLILDDASFKAKYDLMGINVPMGDHKPVYLICKLPSFPESDQYSELCSKTLSSNYDAIRACNDVEEGANRTLNSSALSADSFDSNNPGAYHEIQSSQAKSSCVAVAVSQPIIPTNTFQANVIDNKNTNIYINPTLYPACIEQCNGKLNTTLLLSDSIQNALEINNNNVKMVSNVANLDDDINRFNAKQTNIIQSNSCDRICINIPNTTNTELNITTIRQSTQTDSSIDNDKCKSIDNSISSTNNNHNYIDVCLKHIDHSNDTEPKGNKFLLRNSRRYCFCSVQ